MSKPSTHEMKRLEEISNLIDGMNKNFQSSFEGKLQILELIASRFGGFSYSRYNDIFNVKSILDINVIKSEIEDVCALINSTGISPSLIIAALSREPLNGEDQRKTGAFYTDYRLANFVSDECYDSLYGDSVIADIASGTGILLAALASRYKQRYPETLNKWLSKNVYAYDLSDNALRGAKIALSTLTGNLDVIAEMVAKWGNVDSLVTHHIPERFFDIIVGNPPWGKIKLSRHNFVQGSGISHVYGDEFEEFDTEQHINEKKELAKYVSTLKNKYPILKSTEPDMYMAFLLKTLSLIKMGGKLCMILPAGLIRSKGTTALREHLVDVSGNIDYTLMNNKPRYFSIDTRFKFLLLNLTGNSFDEKLDIESLFYGDCVDDNIIKSEPIIFNIQELREIRPDLTIPEVKNNVEKNLYNRIYNKGIDLNKIHPESKWSFTLNREIDMTNARKYFEKNNEVNLIPVIEGRMIQPFHFGAKKYISGVGRSAVWNNVLSKNISYSQFYVGEPNISNKTLNLINRKRAGYCDIAGQTNERAMMTTVIPPGVVCGNKVPTVLFSNDPEDKMIYLWVAITNSFVYDWLLRRIISTTANYFLVLSVPMPDIDPDSEVANEIIEKSKFLCENSIKDSSDLDLFAKYRANIDLMVAKSYGLDFEDLKIILGDFPLLDRKQPPIFYEEKSTITRDLLLGIAEKEYGIEGEYLNRYEKARNLGAYAYVLTEMFDTVSEEVNRGEEP